MSTPVAGKQKRRPPSRLGDAADFVSNHDDYRADPIWRVGPGTRLALGTLREALVLGVGAGLAAAFASWLVILAGGAR